MTDESERIAHALITTEFIAGTTKHPASLELVWYDEQQGKNVYKLLTGKRARKFSHLNRGDIYYEEIQTS